MATFVQTDGGRSTYVDRLPTPKKYNDCATRAFALATNTPYGRVWQAVTKAKQEIIIVGATGNAYEPTNIRHLSRAAEILKFPRKLVWVEMEKRRRLDLWLGENPNYTGIVRTGFHMTAVSNGHYYDEFDSGRKQVTHYSIWE